jgi:hypothetical protein
VSQDKALIPMTKIAANKLGLRVARQILDAAHDLHLTIEDAQIAIHTERKATPSRIGGLRDQAARRAHVIGRVSLYLESTRKTEDAGPLKQEIDRLGKAVDALEEAFNEAEQRDKLNSALSIISSRMTEWGKKLGIEHADNALRLDLKVPTIIVDTLVNGAVPMENVGSGSNWVGLHVVALLALHEWFVKRKRPVPRFLLLDQPAQGYFPADKDVEGADQSLDALQDADRVAARDLFRFIFDVVEGLAPHFQVVLTEHADLKEEWFQEAVVARWRGADWLVPPSWQSGGGSPSSGSSMPGTPSGGGSSTTPTDTSDAGGDSS